MGNLSLEHLLLAIIAIIAEACFENINAFIQIH